MPRNPVQSEFEKKAHAATVQALERVFSGQPAVPVRPRKRQYKTVGGLTLNGMRFQFYERVKVNGNWRYKAVRIGKGYKRSETGPICLRYTHRGKQRFSEAYPTLATAEEAANKLSAKFLAEQMGLAVEDPDEAENRMSVKQAIEKYLATKADRAPRTRKAYRLHLDCFLDSCDAQFLDEITADTIRNFKNQMAKEGYSGKTQHTRISTVAFMLKKLGVKNPFPTDEMPTVEKEDAVPFEPAELKRFFAIANDEQTVRYKFFLGTACREQEVQFASWKDIDFSKMVYHVRKKEDVGFTPKKHESRDIPLPTELVALLKSWQKKAPSQRWLFVNRRGTAEGHFLREVKTLALKAGLNCGHCVHGKSTCATEPICDHWYLHRFRKTCATRWNEKNVPMRTLQKWLGHKSLETTQLYLGETDPGKLRSNIDAAYGD